MAHLRVHAAAVPGRDEMDVLFHLAKVRLGEEELWPELKKRRDNKRLELRDLSRNKPIVGKTVVETHTTPGSRYRYGTRKKRRK